MATFDAVEARVVACELKLRIDKLYKAVSPIYLAIAEWELNRTDPYLPTPLAIRVQLEAYRTLELERLRLEASVKKFLAATIDDTLTYPTPPSSGGGSGLADGTTIASGEALADGEGS